MDSKLSACSIRFFLFADVLADLLQPSGWILIKPPWRRMLLYSTVKPHRVSLVKPVAYLNDSYYTAARTGNSDLTQPSPLLR
jgi:hypothetical protein